MKPFFLLLLSSYLLSWQSCSVSNSKLSTGQPIMGPYLGLSPTDTLVLIGADILSTSLGEYNGTFAEGGTVFYYTTEVAGKGSISWTEMDESGNWSPSRIAPFSGQYSEYDPLFSPDGTSLYFSSERPLPGQSAGTGTHIWRTQRGANGWAEPAYIPLGVDGAYYSSLTNTGTIFFNTWNTGNILSATPNEAGFDIVDLPESINGGRDVGDPFIDPNGEYLIFRGYFEGGLGRGDLYISYWLEGSWTTPQNLGEPINSSGHEMCPYVTTDGALFIFASDRLRNPYPNSSLEAMRTKLASADNGFQNLYSISAGFIEEKKPPSPTP